MKIILFCPEQCNHGGRFIRLLSTLDAISEVETYTEVEALFERVRQPIFSSTVLVLFVPDHEMMLKLQQVRDTLNDHRLILILGEQSDDLIGDGHKLYPRFIGFAEDDMINAVQVLERIVVNGAVSRNVE